ncbi:MULTISPECIES: PH domain-containing protein [Actinokineospora]|uniref:PH domain-containing protein n=1 Tax=Actinokineospora TaxID=39845 RepID=UPI0016709711|nr:MULTISPECIES: PH domain-containing protein [Actinokineospora]UVS77525.1 Bacterial membrane flanked domain protein [Actinokineospora sp. UTMC 2448]
MDDGEWRLRAPVNLVSKRAVVQWTVRAAIGWIVVLGGLGVWHALGGPDWVGHVLAGLAVAAVVHVAVMPTWRYRVHRWETTPAAVFTRSGWINQEWRLAPVSRIQTVDTGRGPLQQLLKLATVTITTASAAGPLKIEGLDESVAARIVDELATTTQAVPGDAT